ncbi:hypothetical protein [Arthrobacter sp. Y-9]|uniref:hypothetical protein n=1 Tax=Arthrobacter sp. Y-9 TaxID=3039385 RepID=UPI00241DD1AA|nr:hypothetical protein [Arthrobacter sp. Y-9]WFR84595.1 hypothetical protein P9849_02815 [Arthrobacter sp. Y-9]
MDTSTALQPAVQAEAHDHLWAVRSRHSTSEGVVLYERCEDCGSWRIELLEDRFLLPETLHAPRGNS